MEIRVIWFYQLSWCCKLTTVKSFESLCCILPGLWRFHLYVFCLLHCIVHTSSINMISTVFGLKMSRKNFSNLLKLCFHISIVRYLVSRNILSLRKSSVVFQWWKLNWASNLKNIRQACLSIFSLVHHSIGFLVLIGLSSLHQSS